MKTHGTFPLTLEGLIIILKIILQEYCLNILIVMNYKFNDKYVLTWYSLFFAKKASVIEPSNWCGGNITIVFMLV
jgi:hypothetical protein